MGSSPCPEPVVPLDGSAVRLREGAVIVIFGATGDLTRRKLLPSLLHLMEEALLPNDFAILGVGRKEMPEEEFRAAQRKALASFARGNASSRHTDDFLASLFYHSGPFDSPETFTQLRERLAEIDREYGLPGNYVFYLATPPEQFAPIVEMLGAAGLTEEHETAWRRVIIEKPFGTDLQSARELNGHLSRVLAEPQIYRIDHYLGKETVQNILVFRFGNGIFEPLWNRRYIDHVMITVAESLGVEGRGAFYEEAGALRDVVQNHLFMLLSLIAMEPPTSLQGESVRSERNKVVNAIIPMTPELVIQNTVRGQYGPGQSASAQVSGYRQEPNVAAHSATETYAALKLTIENWRWAGVPFYLRTGKRLAARATEIVIVFRQPPLLLYGTSPRHEIGPNRLILSIQPREGMTLQVRAKVPGPRVETMAVGLDFNYADLSESPGATTGYETLLYDCMAGDATLFHRIDAVDAAWRLATPILDVWKSLPPRDFPNYAAGSWGPEAADRLLAADGRSWWRPAC